MLTDQQRQEILDEAFEQIKKDVVKSAINHVDWNVKHELSTSTHKIVREWVEENVKGDMIAALDKRKSFLIEAALVSAEEMAVQLAKVMAEKMAENMASSYDRKKIIEALFG